MFRGLPSVGVSLFVVALPCAGIARSLPDAMPYGEHPVGFQVVGVHDYTRTYRAAEARGPRPMQIGIWYPAPAAGGSATTLGDYTAMEATEESLGEVTAAQREATLQSYRPYLRSDDALVAAFDQPTRAVRDAGHLPGPFPTVVYGASQNGSAFDNAVLCEILASHGYVVASVASKGAHARAMPMNAEGVEAQVRDLEFLAGFLHDYPGADVSRLGAVGFSLGGLSNVLFAIRYRDVDAVVSLDGTIGSPIGFDILNSYPYLSVDSFRTPFLEFAGDKADMAALPFYDAIHFADVHVLKLADLNHLQFSSSNLMFRRGPESAVTAYRSLCEYTVVFLEHHIRGTGPPFERIAEQRPDDIYGAYLHKVAATPPPTQDELFATIRNEGVDRGVAAYREARSAFPDYRMFEFQAFRDLGWQFLREGRKAEAIRLFEVLVDAYPDEAESYRRLGEAYMENGDREPAVANLRAALALDPDYGAVKQMLQRLEP